MFSDCDNGRILFLSQVQIKISLILEDFLISAEFFLMIIHYLFLTSNDEINEETKWWCFLAGIEIPRII